MRIVDIRNAEGSIRSDIRNSVIDFSGMTISLVAIESDVVRNGSPLTGYGICSNGRYAQKDIISNRLVPRIFAATPSELLDVDERNFDPHKIWNCMMTNEKPGGLGDRAVAVGAIDMAVWDLVSKIADLPLWRFLAERYNEGEYDEKVLVYPGGGYYYPSKGLGQLQDEIRSYQDKGYKAVKIKIGGAPLQEDIRRIEAVLKVVGCAENLAVDANGRFDLRTALEYAEALSPYKLFWFEEPGDPLDYRLNNVLASVYQGPLATGENLFSIQDALNLIQYAGLRPDRDWIQIDPALSYGLTEYVRIIDMVQANGWAKRRLIPHGGHQFALNIASGLQIGGAESYPGVFQPFGGFADDCEITDGYANLHQTPGIGMELKSEMFSEILRLLGY